MLDILLPDQGDVVACYKQHEQDFVKSPHLFMFLNDKAKLRHLWVLCIVYHFPKVDLREGFGWVYRVGDSLSLRETWAQAVIHYSPHVRSFDFIPDTTTLGGRLLHNAHTYINAHDYRMRVGDVTGALSAYPMLWQDFPYLVPDWYKQRSNIPQTPEHAYFRDFA